MYRKVSNEHCGGNSHRWMVRYGMNRAGPTVDSSRSSADAGYDSELFSHRRCVQ